MNQQQSAVSTKRKKFHKKALAASDNLEMIKVAPGGGKQQRQIPNPISCACILKEPHKWEGPIIAVSFSYFALITLPFHVSSECKDD